MSVSQFEDLVLYDAARERAVPVRLWSPAAPPWGWLLFSVGFGGEHSGYAYLGRAWAEAGLATAVVEHVGSNLEVLRRLPGRSRQERQMAVAQRVGDPNELAARPRDLLFAHRALQSRFAAIPYGLGGHSYGSYSALAAQGMPTVASLPPLDDALRPAATLVMSPQQPGTLFSPAALQSLANPGLVLTGTRDGLLNGQADYRARRKVFECFPSELAYLVVMQDVEHMAFAGIGLGLTRTLEAIAALTTTWWTCTLRAPAEARELSTQWRGRLRASLPDHLMGECR